MHPKLLVLLLCLIPVTALVSYFVDDIRLWYTFDVYTSIVALIAAWYVATKK